MKVKIVTSTLAALGFLGLSVAHAGALPALPKPAPDAPQGFELKADLVAGKKLYKKNCQNCHGKKGDGNGMIGKNIKPKPRDFTTEGMKKRTDWELFFATKEGGTPVGLSPLMTPWKSVLSDKEIRDVIGYIRTMVKK